MSGPPISDAELAAAARFVASGSELLRAGFERAAAADADRHSAILAAIADGRAHARLVISWDDPFSVRITVDVAGISTAGERLEVPVYIYHVHRRLPTNDTH